ncbi:MAG: phosphate ABC transporter permease PstA [Gammaproteobacteria bacterium]|nr:phosphate ABC transporter permease PstA [Gammaproteobacteria bacterium]
MSNKIKNTAERVEASLKKRYRSERRFRFLGLLSIILALGFLATLLTSIVSSGLPAFYQTYIKLDIVFDAATLGINDVNDKAAVQQADFQGVIREALRNKFPEATDRAAKRQLNSMVSTGASYKLSDQFLDNPQWLNTQKSIWILADDDVDTYHKGLMDTTGAEADRRLNDNQLTWLKQLEQENAIEARFNWTLFTAGDSRDPELAGIKGALIGSLYTILVTLLLAFPIGIAAAIYLEEFAPKNIWTDMIEVNINNLAAVPSVVFGLLGLAVFLNFFGMPRSVPLVGGIVLALVTLPTIIIAGRAAIKSVPPSIREAALGIGASKMQVVTHHVLPLAMPGMLTGAIIGVAHALGETAPLLMIGMVAFIVDIPTDPLSAATVLPVQIYLWSDSPERGFVALTSAAIMVLLAFLVTMNLFAVLLRKRFERRW